MLQRYVMYDNNSVTTGWSKNVSRYQMIKKSY